MAGTTPIPDWFADKEFVWVEGETPLANRTFVVGALVVYLAVIFGLQAWMKDREAMVLKTPALIHNFVLCFGSLLMSSACAYYIAQLYAAGYSVHDLICDSSTDASVSFIRGRLGIVAWWYYASKFYELLDTVLKALKKKDFSFLHVYHHCIVIPLVFSWNSGLFSLQWWGILVNTSVHVVMYYYYFVGGIVGKGYRPWWRVYITTFQLAQFVSVFVNIFVWYYLSLRDVSVDASFPFLHYSDSVCTGDVRVVHFSQAVNVSFLFLFGEFFVRNYLNKKKTKRTPKKQQ